MSRFLKVRTTLREPEFLEEALRRTLDWEIRRDAPVRGFAGMTHEAEIVAVNPRDHYDIGFLRPRDAEEYEIVADFDYGLKGFRYGKEALVDKVQQEYSLARTLRQDVCNAEYEQVLEDDGSYRVSWMVWMPEVSAAY